MCQGTGLGVPQGLASQKNLAIPFPPCGTAQRWYQGGGENPPGASPAALAGLQVHKHHSHKTAALCVVHELLIAGVLFPGHISSHSPFFNCDPAHPPLADQFHLHEEHLQRDCLEVFAQSLGLRTVKHVTE